MKDKFFNSLETKNKFLIKFKDQNNILLKKKYFSFACLERAKGGYKEKKKYI